MFTFGIRFSQNFLEAAIEFVPCLELGGSILGGTNVLALEGNQSDLIVCPLGRGCPYFRESIQGGSTVVLFHHFQFFPNFYFIKYFCPTDVNRGYFYFFQIYLSFRASWEQIIIISKATTNKK